MSNVGKVDVLNFEHVAHNGGESLQSLAAHVVGVDDYGEVGCGDAVHFCVDERTGSEPGHYVQYSCGLMLCQESCQGGISICV